MTTLAPNKHARFETRYPAETIAAVRILLRQHIGLDPMPSYRSIARHIEAGYPVKISGTTVKRMLGKLADEAKPQNESEVVAQACEASLGPTASVVS